MAQQKVQCQVSTASSLTMFC